MFSGLRQISRRPGSDAVNLTGRSPIDLSEENSDWEKADWNWIKKRKRVRITREERFMTKPLSSV
jgi:hypothetical protein